MADLSVYVALGYGRQPIMPSVTIIFPNPQGVLTESLRIGQPAAVMSVSPIFRQLSDENLKLAENVTRILDIAGLAEVAFLVVQPDYNNVVTSVTARIRVSGNTTVVATKALGKPTPDANNVIVTDVTSALSGLTAGNYTCSILLTGPSGSVDSAESTAFTVPV